MTSITVENKHSKIVVEGLENVKEQIKNLVGNKFFHVSFIKADGTTRELHGRFKEYNPKGTGKPIPEDSMRVFEKDGVGFKAFKSFKVDRLKEIRCGDVIIKGGMG